MTGDVACSRYRGFSVRLRRRVPGCKCQEVTQNPSSGSLGGINSAATEAGSVKMSIRRRVRFSAQVII